MSKLVILFFAALVCVAFSAEEGCHLRDENITLKVGDKHSPAGKCQQITCQEGGKIVAVTCPPVIIEPVEHGECEEVVRDSSLPYPGCCPLVSCRAVL